MKKGIGVSAYAYANKNNNTMKITKGEEYCIEFLDENCLTVEVFNDDNDFVVMTASQFDLIGTWED